MAKIKAAIYDKDKEYRERFVDYLMQYKAEEMELSVFSEETYFLNALHVDNYHLVILGCGYEELLFQIKSIGIPILILTEYMQDYVRESLDLEDKQIFYTTKYQSMDVITKRMLLMTEGMRVHKMPVTGSHKLEIIGVFSPIKHELQMMFSLLYAGNLGKEEKVLYINLMEFSGFSELFGEQDYDLSDVIMLIRNDGYISKDIHTYIYEMDHFSYICPFTNPENVKEVKESDIKKLLELIAEYTDYRTIILDIGTGITDYGKLLLNCNKIYSLEKRGYLFEIQIIQFYAYLEKLGDSSLLERIESIEIPYQSKIVFGGGNLLERLNWSELGDFVRSKI